MTPSRDTSSDLHVVLGASGGAGGAVVRALSSGGKRVRAFWRSGRVENVNGIEIARGDALERDALVAACRGASVIHHCVNLPYHQWGDGLPVVMDNVIAAAEETGARVAYCDNLYMYGPPSGPMTEDTPYSDHSRKEAIRARLADRLLEAHASGRVQVFIGRASDFFGPAENAAVSMLVIPAVVAGKRARWIGSLDQPHSLNYIDDVGRALALLSETELAYGDVWHLPAPPPVTGREFIETAFAVAGTPSKNGVISRPMMRLAGMFNRQLREVVEMMYQFEMPFEIDASKFMGAFPEFRITSVREGIEASLRWQQTKV